MAATEMNFGPEWLRALQDGMPKGSNSNSSSSSLSNSMIANSSHSSRPMMHRQSSVKYRYSCEEMLNYYTRDNCYPPKDLVEHEEVFIDKVQDPLLFTEPSIEELNLLSQSINSECIMHKQKSGKENGEGGGGDISRTSDRANDFLRERSETLEREGGSGGRPIKLLNTGEGGMLLRKPPGMGGITPSSSNTLVNSGNFAGLNFGSSGERGSGVNPLRPGRGGSNVNSSERGCTSSSTSSRPGGGPLSGARNVNSLFARVSSYEESVSSSTSSSTTYRSNTATSATLTASKKLQLGSSSTTGNSTSNSIPNSFVPAWRTTVTGTNNSSGSTSSTATISNSTANAAVNSSNATSESKAEWRSNSDASKNWRIDSLTGGGTAGKTTTGKNSSSKTDFFGDGEDGTTTTSNSSSSAWDNQGREYGFQRKRGGLNSTASSKNSSSGKPGFGRSRFDADSNDLFSSVKSKGAFEDFDTFGGGVDDRDLFGGTAIGRPAGKPSSRFSRDYGSGGGNDKWGSGKYESGGRFGRQGGGYQRSNSHAANNSNNNDDDDRFGSSGGMHYNSGGGCNNDDDDYRRNSLPEWSLEDPTTMDVTKVGSFDASGAFHEASFEEDGGSLLSADGDKAAEEHGGRSKKPSGGAGSRILERATKQVDSPKNSSSAGQNDQLGSNRKQSSSSSNGGDATSSSANVQSKKDATSHDRKPSDTLVGLSNNHGSSSQQHRQTTDSWNDGDSSKSGGVLTSSAKIDYFNLSDPRLSPSASPNKQKQSVVDSHQDDDSFAQFEKETQQLLSRAMGDGDNEIGGGSSSHLLSSQLSDFLKDHNHSRSEAQVKAEKQKMMQFMYGQGSTANDDRHHPFSSIFHLDSSETTTIERKQSSVSSESTSAIHRQFSATVAASSSGSTQGTTSSSLLFGGPNASSKDAAEALLNQQRLAQLASRGGQAAQQVNKPLSASVLHDDRGFGVFNYGGPVASVASSVASAASSQQQQQPSLFSSLAAATAAQRQDQRKISAFEHVLASEQEANSGSSSGAGGAGGGQRLNLSMLQAKHREIELEKQSRSNEVLSFTAATGDPNDWYYTDPQGEVQGPFTWSEMYDWFSSGYFTMDLLVRRSTETSFSKLGELCQLYRGVPFFPVKPLGPVAVATAAAASGAAAATSSASPPIGTSGGVFGSGSQTTVPLRHHQGPSPTLHLISNPTLNQAFGGGGGILQQQHHPHFEQHGSHSATIASKTSLGSLFDAQGGPSPVSVVKDDSAIISPPSSSSSAILSMFQRQHSLPPQPIQQQQPTPPAVPPPTQAAPPQQQLQSDNQIATLLGIGPQNAAYAQAQLRHILGQLMKNEQFLQLTTAQQQRVVMERFIQMNQSGGGGQFPVQQQPPPHTEFHLNQQQHPVMQPAASGLEQQQPPHGPPPPAHVSVELSEKAARHEEMIIAAAAKQKQLQQEESEYDQHQRPASHHSAHSSVHSATLGPQSPPPPQAELSSSVKSLPPPHNPLQVLQAAMGTTTSSGWTGNLVPGAMSLSAVEELQRREAEEKFKMQQQQVQQAAVEEDEGGEFEHKVERKQRPSKSKQQSPGSKQEVKVQVQPSQQQPTGGKVQVIDSKPSARGSESPDRMHLLTPLAAAAAAPVQPKKSAWGSDGAAAGPTSASIQTGNNGQPLSISEIQKLQEEKEREEEAKRQAEQAMAAAYQAQQQTASAAAAASSRGPFKWATQATKANEPAHVKTLAEIQAEEAEKAAALRAAQEAEARRRLAANTMVTPLAAIVKAGSAAAATGVWGGGNSVASVPKSSGSSIWDEDENPTLAAAATISSSTANSAATATKRSPSSTTTKIDGALIRKILKTSPTNVKKLEESQLSKLSVESMDDLLRHAVDILNRTFDSIDAPGFMALVKELSKPNDVVEYMQNYLGNSPAAVVFAKFYISKKTYLFNKSKQENAERLKQQQQHQTFKSAATTANHHIHRQSGIWDEEEVQVTSVSNRSAASIAAAAAATSTYNSALKANLAKKAGSAATTSSSASSNSSKSHSAKTGTVNKTPNKSMLTATTAAAFALDNDVNLMTATVESMEEFDSWCLEVIKQNFEPNIDLETFIELLKDIDSPNEITEYVNTYLGQSKLSRDFSKNFILKRSYLRNKGKNSADQLEDMCGPAPALNPISNKSEGGLNDNNGFVTVSSSSKKKKKGRNNSSQANQQQNQQSSASNTLNTASLID